MNKNSPGAALSLFPFQTQHVRLVEAVSLLHLPAGVLLPLYKVGFVRVDIACAHCLVIVLLQIAIILR